MTVTDFLAIRDKSHQLHVCQFLMLEDSTTDKGELTSKRDPIMTKYQWVWRQVTPLCEEYAKNVSPRYQQMNPTRETADDLRTTSRTRCAKLQKSSSFPRTHGWRKFDQSGTPPFIPCCVDATLGLNSNPFTYPVRTVAVDAIIPNLARTQSPLHGLCARWALIATSFQIAQTKNALVAFP